jgi:nitrate reductase assembly molybdenum cofactor insertion protein NarJ
MARLREAYDAAGFDAGTELPDHVAVLLRFAAHLGGDELDELAEYCLAGPVGRMAEQLARTRNPYLNALEAVRHVLGQEIQEGNPS